MTEEASDWTTIATGLIGKPLPYSGYVEPDSLETDVDSPELDEPTALELAQTSVNCTGRRLRVASLLAATPSTLFLFYAMLKAYVLEQGLHFNQAEVSIINLGVLIEALLVVNVGVEFKGYFKRKRELLALKKPDQAMLSEMSQSALPSSDS